MRTKQKARRTKAPLDPVLFAATVPSRKPTPKDITDCKAQPGDEIEPQDYDDMDEMVEDQ